LVPLLCPKIIQQDKEKMRKKIKERSHVKFISFGSSVAASFLPLSQPGPALVLGGDQQKRREVKEK
jgi:hypothetical protein